MDDELIDIVDEAGKVLRQALKSEAHKHGWLHLTVVAYLCDENGDWILVKQAADRQDSGQFVGLVGGHAKAGESEEAALRREIAEEAGLHNITHKLMGRKRFHRQVVGRDENHLFALYEFSTPDEISLNEEGVSTKKFTREELRQAIKQQPDDFGDALYFVMEAFYPHYLPDDWEPRFL
jgi:8-oxo-dGTP pyrophosphatase MutT (NUDIX family)